MHKRDASHRNPDENQPREEAGADRILTIRVSQELYAA
jgi:hypothetical protein